MIALSFRRVRSALFVIWLTIFALLMFSSSAAAFKYGDINSDGEINVRDVVLLVRHVLQIEGATLTAAEQAAADVNGDGLLNVRDITLIMQKSLGHIDEFPVVQKNLQVSSVSAVNPKQVEVSFNRALTSSEQAKMTAENYHVGLQASPLTDRLTGVAGDGSAVKLKEDNRTVLLTMANGFNFASGSTANRVQVKKAVGLGDDYTVTNLAFTDEESPTLVAVRISGPRTVVMTFSEPLDRTILPTNINLNDGTIPLDLAGRVYIDAQRELRVNATVDLIAGNYKLAILSGNSLRDYSGNMVAPASKTFTFTPPTTPPTVKVISATEKVVTIQFSRAINQNTLIGNAEVLFRHTADTTTNQVTGTALTNPSGDRRTFIIDFGSKTLPLGSTTMWMKYASGTPDARKIKDTWGNIIPPATFTVTRVSDTVAPTATIQMVPGSNTQIDVQYSEAVLGGATRVNYSLKKGPAAVTISSVVHRGSNVYRLTTSEPLQGSYSLTISNVTDSSPARNPLGTPTLTVNVPDLISPSVVEVMADKIPAASARVIYVAYSEEMGASALDPGYYRLVNAVHGTRYSLPAGTTITKTGAVIKITLPSSLIVLKQGLGSPTDLNRLYIGSVQDLAGNILDNPGAYTILDALKFDAKPSSVIVHSTSQISFTVGRRLQAIDASRIKRTAGPVSATSATFVNHDNGTATISAFFPAGTFTTGLTGQTINLEENALTDRLGFHNDNRYRVGGVNTPITVDMASPLLISAETADLDRNGYLDTIKVTYSENIHPASVSSSTYTVQGYNITGVTVTDNVVQIALAEGTVPDTGNKPQLTQVLTVQDNIAAPRNTLAPQAPVATIDKAVPVMISARTASANTIEITYSEPVTSNNAEPGQFVYSGTDSAAAVVAAGNKVTLTLTTGGLASGVNYPLSTIVYTGSATAANRIKDAAANDARSPQTLTGVVSGF